MPSLPAAGSCSDTIHGLKRRKRKTRTNWSLDQAVGFNELVMRQPYVSGLLWKILSDSRL